jgi:hypothetical protein
LLTSVRGSAEAVAVTTFDMIKTTKVPIALAAAGTLIVSRFVWTYLAIWLPRLLSWRIRPQDPMPPWSYPAVLSCAGMLGVVSLPTALALPMLFPCRDIIVFLAFCAIFATLVVQGTTLGWVIRRLGLEQDKTPLPAPETAQARAELAAASLDAVQAHLGTKPSEHGEAAAELVGNMRSVLSERTLRVRMLRSRPANSSRSNACALSRLRLPARSWSNIPTRSTPRLTGHSVKSLIWESNRSAMR